LNLGDCAARFDGISQHHVALFGAPKGIPGVIFGDYLMAVDSLGRDRPLRWSREIHMKLLYRFER
jgi:hypothetical protein